MLVLIILILSAVSLLTFLFWSKRSKVSYWSTHGVLVLDFDHIVPYYKRLLSSFSMSQVVIDFYKHIKASSVPFGGILQSPTPNLILIDPELIKQVLIKDFDSFVNRRVGSSSNTVHHRMLGSTKDKFWKDLRSTMIQVYATGNVRRKYSLIQKSSADMVDFVRRSGVNVEMRDLFVRVTIDIFAGMGWGIQSSAFGIEDTEFTRMAREMQDPIGEKDYVKLIARFFGDRFCKFFRISLQAKGAVAWLEEFTKGILKAREGTYGGNYEDFIQFMLDSRAKAKSTESEKTEIPDDYIVANTLLFFLANPVGSVMEFACYELALNQEIQDKLFQELKAAVSEEGVISYEDISQMPYLDKFMSETLRMYPPSMKTDRCSTKRYTFPGTSLTIEKGILVTVPILGLHYDPDYYPDPLRFDPERFSPENKAQRNPYTYLAFGHGPRACIATRFALTLCKTFVSQLVLNFHLEPSTKTLIPPKLSKTHFRVAETMWLTLNPRNQCLNSE